jgi:hypothetical protein
LTIRNATSADLEALLDLYVHLNPADEPLPDDDILQQRWLAFVTQPGFTCLLGFDSERLVCSCCLAILPNLTP